MRAQWANEVIGGGLNEFHCQECMDKGYIIERRDGGTVCVECKCMTKRRTLRRIRESGLSDMIERYTFDAYKVTQDWQRMAKQIAEEYVSDYNGKWFVAAGAVGSGKTHLCTAICSELLNAGLNVRYMLWRDESVRIKSVINEQEEYRQLVEPLKKARVLYIDDFFKAGRDKNTGAVKVTEGDINLAFEILNARYNQSNCATIISSELTINQIIDIDSGLGSRIYERSKGHYLQLTGDSKNYRMQ